MVPQREPLVRGEVRPGLDHLVLQHRHVDARLRHLRARRVRRLRHLLPLGHRLNINDNLNTVLVKRQVSKIVCL